MVVVAAAEAVAVDSELYKVRNKVQRAKCAMILLCQTTPLTNTCEM